MVPIAEDTKLRARALARWEGEGGALDSGPHRPQPGSPAAPNDSEGQREAHRSGRRPARFNRASPGFRPSSAREAHGS